MYPYIPLFTLDSTASAHDPQRDAGQRHNPTHHETPSCSDRNRHRPDIGKVESLLGWQRQILFLQGNQIRPVHQQNLNRARASGNISEHVNVSFTGSISQNPNPCSLVDLTPESTPPHAILHPPRPLFNRITNVANRILGAYIHRLPAQRRTWRDLSSLSL